MSDRPLVYAHRGSSEALPEHTLAAYLRALDEGADGLECDVRLTRDGHLVCVHDGRLERTSNGRGWVSARTLAELAELDFGSWHPGSAQGGAGRPPAAPPTTSAEQAASAGPPASLGPPADVGPAAGAGSAATVEPAAAAGPPATAGPPAGAEPHTGAGSAAGVGPTAGARRDTGGGPTAEPDRTRLLTLDRLLGAVRDAGRPVRLLIETKHPTRYGSGVERRLVRMLDRHGLAEARPGDPVRVTIMSFSPLALRTVHALAPALPTALLLEVLPRGLRPGWLPFGTRIAGPSIGLVRARPGLVEAMRAAGNRVYVWTVNAPEDVSLVTGYGVDGIITDRPAAVLDQLGR